MPRYNPAEIEPRWQDFWEKNSCFACPRLPGDKKAYYLDMFPYPSGDGLHVGHPEGYTATDIMSRFMRKRGYSVMHPMGFDAFGLPAEEHAIKTGTHPRIQTEANINTFRRQLKMLGFSYDWQRELATVDPEYVRWTQWIFSQIYDTWFDPETQTGRPISDLPIPADIAAEGETAIRRYQDEHRLAYQSEVAVNWCPALGTVLANEEVIDGLSERGGHPVERRPLRQWMLRITAYADRLESGLTDLNWPESIKTLQRNWIGRSEGAEVDFFIGDTQAFTDWKQRRSGSQFPRNPEPEVLRVYTTRPDTLFGATYMVMSPEHPLVDQITTAENLDAVKSYQAAAVTKSELERSDLGKEKTGVSTGAFAVNPVNGKRIPIWIADYVLMSYGTGAIMAVPAHDARDFEFAQQFNLPIIPVVDPGSDHEERDAILAGTVCSPAAGVAVNSAQFDGLATAEFKQQITSMLDASNLGTAAVNYKLRDWLFSRQRFWGEPFPILHELDEQGQPNGLMRVAPDAELPITLPELEDFKPHGRPEPLLEKAPEDWLYLTLDGKRYKRETNTMPQWAGSCWYYLRYLDPKNLDRLVDQEVEAAWMPVDLYVGGAEHAVLHLLYSRFWHKVLYDRGVVSTDEPFGRLVNQGMILGEIEITGYRTAAGEWVTAKDVGTNEKNQKIANSSGEEVRGVRLADSQTQKVKDKLVLRDNPDIVLETRAFKMSKSRGNVVNPDDIVREYGADALRLYEMFMGPLEATKPWSMDGVNGVYGFLSRVWRLVVDEQNEELVISPAITEAEQTREESQVVHRTIAAVTKDTQGLSFNTAIARMMEFVNFFTKRSQRPKSAMETIVLLLAPYAPHIAEELWSVLGHTDTLAYEPWPEFDESLLHDETIEIPVQINGKLRSKVNVPREIAQDDLVDAAKQDDKVAESLAGRTIKKTIVIPGRLVNFVVG